MQNLLPAYQLSILFQTQTSLIAEVVVSIKRLIYIWTNMDFDGPYKTLAKFLIVFVKAKFRYELNSPIYKVLLFMEFNN